MNFSNKSGCEVTFWMNHDSGYSGDDDRLTVQASTDAVSWANLTTISRYDAGAPGWVEHTVSLGSFDGQASVYVGFLGISEYGNSVYIDDVEVTASAVVLATDYDQTILVSLDAGETQQYYLPSWTPSGPGTYTVTACTEFPDDANNANNCSTVSGGVPNATFDAEVEFIISPTGSVPPVPQDVIASVHNNGTGAADLEDLPVRAQIFQYIPADYFFDFEADDGGWIPSGIMDWEWTNTYDSSLYVQGGYPPNVPPPTATSGTGLWGTKLYSEYSNSGSDALLTQSFDLSAFTGSTLSFACWSDINGNWDYLKVFVEAGHHKDLFK